MNPSANIQQLANRLENSATSSSRIDTLKELQALAKLNPSEVGKHTIQLSINMLKDHGGAEEYIEALELVLRLVKCKDKATASSNADIILEDNTNVELLLDLLECEDGLVGVMASDILSYVHATHRNKLEKAIQECPAGMNKLLNSIPDRSREEVSNQAIILISQLTESNEDMKKTVAFNEGFEILFRIMQTEESFSECTSVTQDCLLICNNILTKSETCQRLFYGMGGNWHMYLLPYFSPSQLEARGEKKYVTEEDGESGDSSEAVPWFEDRGRLVCATYAMQTLANSLDVTNVRNKEHQKVLCSTDSNDFVASAAHWLIRNGPVPLLLASLNLLYRVAEGNASTTCIMLETVLQYSHGKKGKHLPELSDDAPVLMFAWKLPVEDNVRIISLPALLADRYIFPSVCWKTEGFSVKGDIFGDSTFIDAAESCAQGCLRIFESMLASDTPTSELIMQHILAPPPPPMDMEQIGFGSDDASYLQQQGVGGLVLNTLVDTMQRILSHHAGGVSGSNYSKNNSLSVDVDVSIRCCNILGVMLYHGGTIARELCTAINTTHVCKKQGMDNPKTAQPILPFLLSAASRSLRIPNTGYVLTSALFRVLSVAASSCERASRQMLEDPTNLFVVDLATRASEGAGIPSYIQTMSCLFLGCCFESIEDKSNDDILSRKSLLNLIDSKVGLSRFSDILKRGKSDLTSRDIKEDARSTSINYCPTYKAFYEEKVEAIRSAIFNFYAGVSGGESKSGNSAESQVIQMQKDHIAQLEEQLKEQMMSQVKQGTLTNSNQDSIDSSSQELVQQLKDTVQSLRQDIAAKDSTISDIAAKEESLTSRLQELESQIAEEKSIHLAASSSMDLQHKEELQRLDLQHKQELQTFEDKCAQQLRDYERVENEHKTFVAQHNTTVLELKEKLNKMHNVNRTLQEDIESKDRRLQLLEEECRGPMPFEKLSAAKSSDLESRNATLRKQVMQMETDLKVLQDESQAAVRSLKGVIHRFMGSLDNLENESVSIITERVDVIVDNLLLVVGQCSDIAEGAKISFETSESNLQDRLYEIASKLAVRIQELSEENETIENSLSREVSERESQSMQAKTDFEYLEMELELVRKEKDRLQSQQEGVSSSSAAISSLEFQLNEREIEILHLREVIEDSEAQRGATEKRLREIEEEWKRIVDHSEKLELAMTKNEEILDLQIAEKDELIQELTSCQKSLYDKIAELSEGNENCRKQVSALTAELESVAHSNNLDASASALQQVALEREELLTTHAANVELLNQKISELLSEKQEILSNFGDKEESWNKQFANMHSEAQRILSTHALLEESLRTEVSRLVSEKQELLSSQSIQEESSNARISQLSSQNLEMSAQIKELEEFKKDLQANIDNCSAQILSKDTEIVELYMRLANADDCLEEALRLREENSAMSAKLVLLETSQKNMSILNDEISDLKSENSSLARERELLCDKLDTLEKRIVDLTYTVHNLESTSSSSMKEVTELRSANDGLHAVCYEQKKSIEELSRTVAELELKLREDEVFIQVHKEQIRELSDIIESTKISSSDKENAIQKLEFEMEVISDINNKLKQDYGSLNDSHQVALDEVSALKLSLQRKTEEFDSISVEASAAQMSWNNKSLEYAELFEKYEHQKQVLASKEASSSSSHNKFIDVLRAEKESLMQETLALKSALSKVENKYDALKQQSNLQAGKIAGYDEVIVGLEKQIARHEDERDDLNSTIDSLKREVKKLKDSSKSRSAEVDSYSTKPQTSGNGTIAHSVAKFDATALSTNMDHKLQQLSLAASAVNAKLNKLVGVVERLQKSKRSLKALVGEKEKETRMLSRKSDAVMSSAKMLLQFLIDTEVFPRQFPQHISTSVKEKLAEVKGQASKLTADAIIGIIREVLEKIIFAHWSASQDFIESLESRDVAIKEAQVQLAKAQSTVKLLQESNTAAIRTPDKMQNMKFKSHDSNSGVSSSITKTISPTVVQETAKLHVELLKERNRLNKLQEQHSDLLGLLAQQEVELQVFSQKLRQVVDARQYSVISEEVRRVAIERYGAYISFRGSEVDSDLLPSSVL